MHSYRTTILNVDDHVPARYARTRLLKQAGFKVDEAGTGEDDGPRPGDVSRPGIAGCEPAGHQRLRGLQADQVPPGHRIHYGAIPDSVGRKRRGQDSGL